ATSRPLPSIAGRTATAMNTIRSSIRIGPRARRRTLSAASGLEELRSPTATPAPRRTRTWRWIRPIVRLVNCSLAEKYSFEWTHRSNHELFVSLSRLAHPIRVQDVLRQCLRFFWRAGGWCFASRGPLGLDWCDDRTTHFRNEAAAPCRDSRPVKTFGSKT